MARVTDRASGIEFVMMTTFAAHCVLSNTPDELISLSTELVGQIQLKKFGCHDMEQLQNIIVYCLSPTAEPHSSLQARHAALILVGELKHKTKERVWDFTLAASSQLMFTF